MCQKVEVQSQLCAKRGGEIVIFPFDVGHSTKDMNKLVQTNDE